MNGLPNFLHTAAGDMSAQFAPKAKCGRRVTRLAMTSGEKVTCPKCRAALDREAAEQLIASTVQH